MLTVAPIGKTKRVTRRSNFNVSSKHRNVTGNDAALGINIKFAAQHHPDPTLNLFQYPLAKPAAFHDKMRMDSVVSRHKI